MKFLFTAYDWSGICARLRERGHEVVSKGEWGDGKAQTDAWWNWMIDGKTPADYSEHLFKRAAETDADVIVIGKGWHVWDGRIWNIEPSCLAEQRALGRRIVYVSWDDPDQVPQVCATGMLQHVDVIGTCCTDLERCIKPYRTAAHEAKIFLYWPGWDQVAWEPTIAEPVEETCDMLIGGSAYVRPNEEYAGPARRDIARAAIKLGWNVELWGSDKWLNPHCGGPDLARHYRGSYGYRMRGMLWRRARVNVNVHLRYGPQCYLNDRFFMLAGCGKAFVCDDQPGVAEYFPEVSYFKGGDLDDCVAKMKRLHAMHATEREQIGSTLRRRVLAAHTLAHRADAMLNALL